MDNRKTSQGFAKFSIKTLVYVVMIVVAIVCATTAYSFGSQIFTVQSYLYEVRKIKAGTYSFNTSQSNEEIFKIINAGPEEDKKETETTTKSKGE